MGHTQSNGRSREVRIGLVMYGGVSLAIYMNGVANELFRAVRGRGVYKLFKTLTESDLVVDVVSGASAGGINGMFLAFALCNELEFSECANLWRRHGDIKDLLRKPDSPVRSQTSLLDSEEYYEPHLAAAFEQMWTHRIDAKQEKGAPSRSNELDLFVAGTDFNGRRSTTVDSAAHVIDVKDYRAKFWLKHRAGRKTQLDPRADALGRRDTPALAVAPNAATEALPRTGFSALAKLARITSCFPAAFAPVSLEVPPRATADQVDTPTTAVARKLGVWGLLEPGQYHFLDGGILDNKPFTSTIQAIFYRMANRPVQRHLLYVEPDPERFQDEQPRVPNFLSSAIDSLTRLPSYESIAGDLQDIGKHNDSIESYKRTCAELRNWVMRGPTRRSEPPGAPGHGRQGDAARAIYDRARLQSLADQVAQGLLSLEPGSRLDDDAKALLAKLRHALDQAIAQAESRMCGSRAVANGLFQRYDVEFRLRRLMHLTYVLMPAIRESPERATQQTHSEGPEPQGAPPVPTPVELLEPADSQLALYEIGHRVALLEIVRAKLLSAIEQNAPEWRRLKPGDVWGVVLDRLDVVLDIAELPPAVLEALRGERPCQEQLESLSKALEPRTRPGYNPAAGPRTSLLSLVDQGEAAIVGGFEAACAQKSRGSQQRPVEHEYLRFEALDQVLFPIQYVAGLREQDIIRTVRVSPLDAQRGCSAGKFSEKVTGETLAHFGAFLKRSWRSNDI
ncbi:MAG: patatin-like protein, partial [Deltaproteobacteria bacterium]